MALPNALTDGSYDSPGDPNYGVGANVSAPEIIALQRHPEVLQDPSVVSAATPEARTMAVITALKKGYPDFDPQGVYKVNSDGTVSPNNSSWFSDHLPLITGLMGAAIGGAGLLDGLGGGGAGAAGSGAAAGGSGGAAGAGAGSAGLGAIEGGASGLTDAGLAGLGTGAMGAVPVGSGAAVGTGAFDAAGNFIGDSTVTGATGGTGVLGSIGKYAKALSGIGGAISSATGAAANQRIAQNDPYVQRGKLEDDQRNQDLKNLYMADKASHPSHSPFDPVAPTMPSGDYAAALKAVSGQGLTDLSKPPQYGVGSFPSLQPGALAQIGQWAGPILKTIGSIPGLFGG